MPQNSFSHKLNHLIHFQFTPPKIDVVERAPADIMEQLEGNKASSLFMGQFTREQIVSTLERFEIIGRIGERGFRELEIEIEPRTAFEHRLTIRCLPKSQNDLLGEIVVKEGIFRPTSRYVEITPDHLELIFIEWMLMQHPNREFSDRRNRLPGQNWPGLGVGRQALKLLLYVVKTTEKDGLLNFPEYFHNAFFYSEKFYFYNPRKQAELLAIYRDLSAKGMTVAEISFAAYFDAIIDAAAGMPYRWSAEEQICPVSERLAAVFAHPDYQKQVEQALPELRFDINQELFDRKFAERERIHW